MSVTNISSTNRYILWGKAAGRCQYRGCNKPLFIDALTKSEFNQAYIAHIVADVPGGPRDDVAGHPVKLLLEMKKEHEERIEKITDIAPDMHSHIVTYKANVGVHTPVLTYESVREYLLPQHYPAMSSAIDLGMSNSPQRDKDESFWRTEIETLVANFNDNLRPKLRKGEIKHLSMFAFAPIPLLIKLGTLINDIHDAEVHQPIRNPKTWKLSDHVQPLIYSITEPQEPFPTVALNISLSGTVNNDRITSVLGNNVSIYTLTIASPFNDFLKSKKHLQDFSIEIRKLLNSIKAKYNSQTTLHVFPAMPIATAIEFGRVWMPKADMPLSIYDENTANSGFFKAIEIKN
jgi:SMODS-associated and fused to various effectors sensor domain